MGASAAAERVVRLLTGRGLTLAVAESCTGGLIGHLLTNVPGCSACFLGGIVPYQGRAKVALLGVPEAVIRQHGEVAAETARAMAAGVRERLDADLAVAVTGIAGPGGGTETKPVGLVYLAVVDRQGRASERRAVWQGGREANKLHSAAAAFALIEAHLAKFA